MQPVTLDAQGRAAALAAIDTLSPGGGTNLWDGLRLGLDQLRACPDTGALPVLLLLTDGDPSASPPEGEVRPIHHPHKLRALGARISACRESCTRSPASLLRSLSAFDLSLFLLQVGSYVTYVARNGLGAATLLAFGFGYDGAPLAKAPPCGSPLPASHHNRSWHLHTTALNGPPDPLSTLQARALPLITVSPSSPPFPFPPAQKKKQ